MVDCFKSHGTLESHLEEAASLKWPYSSDDCSNLPRNIVLPMCLIVPSIMEHWCLL
jgi:hypothetical protein